MGSACFPGTVSSRLGPLSCSRGFASADRSRARAGSQMAFSPLKDGDRERGVAKACLAGVDRRWLQLCHRFGRQTTSHGSVEHPGGLEGASARRCVLAVVVNTGSHTSYSEVSS
jgi:hypothetical protein